MRILKKSSNNLQNKIENLELEIQKLNTENYRLKQDLNQESIFFTLAQLAEKEGTDILIYNKDEEKISVFLDKLFVLPNIPTNIAELKILIHPEDHNILEDAIEKPAEKGNSVNQLRLINEKDGSREVIPVELIVFSNSSNANKIILSIKDNSLATKQKKELLKSREKVEESDKLKSSILLNISHQIRTPLNSITGFAELLAATDFDSRKRKEYIDIIKQQSKRILALIDDISEIAKLETGQISLSKIPCNIKLVLKEILIGLNHQRNEKQQELVELKLNTPDGQGLEIMADSGRLQQTLMYIINYSLRYTQKGYIEFGYTFEDQAEKLIFFVNDTSDGLSKEEQKVIFNKFSVIEPGENYKMEDAGLGLTIAKNIIKNIGGKIWIESEEGKGNSFMFSIPFERVPSTEHVDIEKEITTDQLFQWPNKRVLIVDDEEVNAMFLEAVFQGTGAQTLLAKNGHEAVELCKNISGIDLVLMDLKMPLMNGLKATQEIRKFNTKLPIIAQTALASEEDIQKCALVGCNDCIIKPIEIQELMTMVNKYLCD